jgi:thiol-disulfide isomerase/thioredoxin
MANAPIQQHRSQFAPPHQEVQEEAVSPVKKDSHKQIKKFADFEVNCRYFDSLLVDLQEEYKDHILDDYQSLGIYSNARMVRDSLYIPSKDARCPVR